MKSNHLTHHQKALIAWVELMKTQINSYNSELVWLQREITQKRKLANLLRASLNAALKVHNK